MKLPRKPIPRYTPLARGGPIARSGRPIRKKKRSASDFARIYGSKARVRFVTRLPCAACGYAGELPRHNAHTPDGSAGTGYKGGYLSIISLCSHCHIKQDDVNGGWLSIGLTAEGRRRAAENTEAEWQAHQQREGEGE